MAREGLVIDLRSAVYQAKKTGATVRKTGVRLRSEGRVTEVNLEVTPIVDPSGREPYYLLLFQTVERPTLPKKPPLGAARAKKKKKGSDAEHEIEALRGELAATQEDLRSIIEEQEATNEELQSANEEILSSNEELQSTNEELETAKEELQATNEELT